MIRPVRHARPFEFEKLGAKTPSIAPYLLRPVTDASEANLIEGSVVYNRRRFRPVLLPGGTPSAILKVVQDTEIDGMIEGKVMLAPVSRIVRKKTRVSVFQR